MIWELIRQEWVKLFSNRYIYALLALVLASVVVSILTSVFSPPASGMASPPQLWADGAGLGHRLGVFLILVVGAMGFSQEFSQGTAKTMLVLPLHRWQWALAKVLFLISFSLGLVLFISALAWVVVALASGWGVVMREGMQIATSAQVWEGLGLAVLLSSVFMLPVGIFALMVGLHFSSSGAAVGTTLLSAILIESVVRLGNTGKILFFFHLSRPFEGMERLGKGVSFDWAEMASTGLVSALLGFSVCSIYLFWRFSKMDIHA